MMIMTKTSSPLFVALTGALLLLGCKSITTSEGEKVKPFAGTIIYDVKVEQKVDTTYEKNKKALFGNEMHLTVFRNGDIQRLYNGSSTEGYDMCYVDLEKNSVFEKYNNSDSLYTHSLHEQNISKLANLRMDDEEISVLNYKLDKVGISAQEAPSTTSTGRYLTIKYWYASDLKIDKSLYTGVNDDLWNYFMSKSDGAIYLKYEIDYFTYKVTYTAKEILPGKFEKARIN
jgi:hypothetical protein